MGYRRYDPPKKPKNRSMQKLATPHRIYMHNGETASLAIPCYYQEIRHPIPVHHHSRPRHDHRGWPDPKRPDRSCQHWDFASHCCTVYGRRECSRHCERFVDFSKLWPIHLEEEGYETAEVTLMAKDGGSGSEDGLTATASIDDNVVRIELAAACDNVLSSDGEIAFEGSVFLDGGGRHDLAALFEVFVLPAPIS